MPESERKLIGTLLGGCNARREVPRLLNLWRAGRLDLEGMITHRRPLGEVNEAFAAQSLACIRGLELDPSRVNTRGGARHTMPGFTRCQRPSSRIEARARSIAFRLLPHALLTVVATQPSPQPALIATCKPG